MSTEHLATCQLACSAIPVQEKFSECSPYVDSGRNLRGYDVGTIMVWRGYDFGTHLERVRDDVS